MKLFLICNYNNDFGQKGKISGVSEKEHDL